MKGNNIPFLIHLTFPNPHPVAALHPNPRHKNKNECQEKIQVCHEALQFNQILLKKKKKAALLKYNLHTVKFTHLKHTVQWILVHSPSRAIITTILERFRHPKETTNLR